MKYYYKKPEHYTVTYGKIHKCNHPVYNYCTLFKINKYGLAVIQQRFDSQNKVTYWSYIDDYLVDTIYLHERFEEFFYKYAAISQNGIYPTVSVRQIMYGLKMKPLKREVWETCFDKKPI